MSKNFVELPNLKLDNSIITELHNLEYKRLPISTKFGPPEFRKCFCRYFPVTDYFDFASSYGLWFNKTCTVVYYILPDEINDKIVSSISDFFKANLQGEEIAVRLQVIYNGSLTPLHIDNTRTVSLVYPITHNATSFTCFYQCSEPPREGMANPAKCKSIESVSIDRVPTLLDAKKVHAVVFDKNNFTEQSPRISLSVKWKNTDFESIVSMLD